jgi:pimeloyl-ACP methyl ester carboxylesterase
MIRFIEHGDIRLWTESFGAEGSPCALLLCGAGAPSAFWPTEFCRRLAAEGLFILRYDHRDIGYSTHTSASYDIFALLADALAILDAYEVKIAHLIGHSMGGYLTALAAVHQASRVLSATMISSGPTVTAAVAAQLGLSTVKPEIWQALLNNKPTGDWASDLPGWMRSWRLLHGSCPLDEEMAVRYTQELYTRDARDASVAQQHIAAMATVPAELADDLKRVTAPSLVLHGTEDPLVPIDHGAAVARLIPGCRFRPLSGAGHMFFHDDLWERMAGHILVHVRAADRMEPTPQMLAFYEQRTREHIERVGRCLALLARVTDHGDELMERARIHDASKFGPEERIPYVWLTEYHRCRRSGEPFEYPEGIAERVKRAIRHHLTTNRHHAEFHADPNDMTDVDLIEMVCDWTAMAQEFGQDGGSAHGWADKTVGKRVAFNAEKRWFIYQMIKELDRQIAANP